MNKIKQRFFHIASLNRCHPSLASNVSHSKHCSERLTFNFSFIYTTIGHINIFTDNPTNISSKSNYCNCTLPSQKVLK